jgi:pyrroloquinoline quinone (PQQ) biosynthesis protein C
MANQVMSAAAAPGAGALERFHGRVERELLRHPIIVHNPFASWFSGGEFTREPLRQFIVQFSVFSNQFLVAQLLKTVNAPTLAAMRASKEILANEIGVVFARPRVTTREHDAAAHAKDGAGEEHAAGHAKDRAGEHDAAAHAKDNAGEDDAAGQAKDRAGEADAAAHAKGDDTEYDPELVAAEGTVEGGVFHFRAAHFEWLLRIAEALGLTFDEVGKRQHGSRSTLFFCDELLRLYGSEDPIAAEGASFAVEHWAAAGFWKELIQGLERYRARTGEHFSIAFFTWHDRLEDQHAGHTEDELAEAFRRPGFDEDRFLSAGREMLDGVQAFWLGLDEMRRAAIPEVSP